ncbi:MAG TPA: ABC transporter ATP-binding protein [Gemmatimonadaceae bacterium]
MRTGTRHRARRRDAAGDDAVRYRTERDPANGTALIHFDRVGKRYRSWTGREIVALDDFTLEVQPGEVFGLAGPNGAGKSTLISLLLGFLGPTTGEVRIHGLAPRRFVEHHGVGYLSELVNIQPAWRVHQALHRYALLAGVPADELHARIERAIGWLGLEEHRAKRVRQLSKGNLQRLGLAQALLHDEQVIVLDEPTHGLDPVWTQRFRDIVQELRQPDRIILIASHNLDELARLADRVAILDHGRLQRVVAMRGAGMESGERVAYRLVVSRGGELVTEVFTEARLIGREEYEIPDASLEEVNAGVAALLARGVLIRSMHPSHSALEAQFREVVAGSAPMGESS